MNFDESILYEEGTGGACTKTIEVSGITADMQNWGTSIAVDNNRDVTLQVATLPDVASGYTALPKFSIKFKFLVQGEQNPNSEEITTLVKL